MSVQAHDCTDAEQQQAHSCPTNRLKLTSRQRSQLADSTGMLLPFTHQAVTNGWCPAICTEAVQLLSVLERMHEGKP